MSIRASSGVGLAVKRRRSFLKSQVLSWLVMLSASLATFLMVRRLRSWRSTTPSIESVSDQLADQDGQKMPMDRCERALEDIKKAVFEENLTLANLKRRIAYIVRDYQHQAEKGE